MPHARVHALALSGLIAFASIASSTVESRAAKAPRSARAGSVELGRPRGLISSDLVAFNQLVRDRNVPAVLVRIRKDPKPPATGKH